MVVVYGFMDSHKDMIEPIQDTNYQAFFQRGIVWNFQRGIFVVYSWWMRECREMRRENKEVGDANLLSPNLYVLPALSSQLLVF